MEKRTYADGITEYLDDVAAREPSLKKGDRFELMGLTGDYMEENVLYPFFANVTWQKRYCGLDEKSYQVFCGHLEQSRETQSIIGFAKAALKSGISLDSLVTKGFLRTVQAEDGTKVYFLTKTISQKALIHQ